jgi:hypothetical protein
VALLADAPALGQTIGLPVVPHYTTLQKAPARLLEQSSARQLLDGKVERARKKLARSRRRRPTRPGFQAQHPS